MPDPAWVRDVHFRADQRTRAWRRSFLDAVVAARDQIDTRALEQAIRLRRFGDAYAIAYAAWEQAAAPLQSQIAQLALAGMQSGAAAAQSASTFAQEMVFDATNPHAVTRARTYAYDLIREMTDDQRAAIRSIITRTTQGAFTVQSAAREIRQTIGLTARMEGAVANYRARLSPDLTPTRRDALVERYRAKSIRSRAETIARTETLRAVNAGQEELWTQAVETRRIPMKKKWIVTRDDLLCPKCRPMQQQPPVDINAPFQTPLGTVRTPPMHPNCRCTVGLVRASGRQTRVRPVAAPAAPMPTIAPPAPPQPARRPARQPRARLTPTVPVPLPKATLPVETATPKVRVFVRQMNDATWKSTFGEMTPQEVAESYLFDLGEQFEPWDVNIRTGPTMTQITASSTHKTLTRTITYEDFTTFQPVTKTQPVGISATRTIRPPRVGAPKEASHDLFVVDEELQGTSISKNLLREHFKLYDQLGVRHVALDANLDVGGYAWARAGFVPEAASDASQLAKDIMQRARLLLRDGEITEDAFNVVYTEAQRLDAGKRDALWRIADLKTGSLDGTSGRYGRGTATGKKVLLKLEWRGTIDLSDDAMRARLESYFAK